MVKIEEIIHDDHIHTLYIGQNAQENWDIIGNSHQNDIWFHAEGVPSCHVVLEVGNCKLIDKSIFKKCAITCKEHTNKLLSIKKLKIIYTNIKNVKKSTIIGSVTTTNTKNIII